ncbi:hypothetical protein BDP27DRAFT_1421541 [Rhodocollybia butyracea]|uniref:Uncharacterized protein n=1 Tax=Rhodocollybia butyracea TaxID=206335 RepID=A0A9P5U7J3_9AGAR|nr:hypothetical protein BDP27DRAFT_1421541 [Rhodocollybia butyracea]
MKTSLIKTSLQTLSLSTLFIPNKPEIYLKHEAYGLIFPTPVSVWVDPIGTASDGSETTFVYHEIDSGDAGCEFPLGYMYPEIFFSLAFTMIASASGFRQPDLALTSFDCSLESPSTGGCVYAALDDETGTSIDTVTETGLQVSFIEIPISAPTQTAGSTPSESGSGTGSATGSDSAHSTGNPQNGAASILSQLNPRLFVFIGLVGFSLVY